MNTETHITLLHIRFLLKYERSDSLDDAGLTLDIITADYMSVAI